MEKISVIVPIFNVGRYLSQCIQSIVDQSYQNLEIILVVDGATDRSLKICQYYAQKDRRITVLYETNAGSGAARNYGLKVATGEYVSFVDGDDFIGTDYLLHLYQSMKHFHSDIACDFYYRLDNHGNYSFYLYGNDPDQEKLEGVYTPQEWLTHNDTSLIGQIFEQPWPKLIKTSLFKNISFPQDSLGEDAMTMWKVHLAAHRISYINLADYCWRLTRSSASTNEYVDLHYLQNIIHAFEEHIACYQQLNVNTDFIIYEYLFALEKLYHAAVRHGNDELSRTSLYKITMIKNKKW